MQTKSFLQLIVSQAWREKGDWRFSKERFLLMLDENVNAFPQEWQRRLLQSLLLNYIEYVQDSDVAQLLMSKNLERGNVCNIRRGAFLTE